MSDAAWLVLVVVVGVGVWLLARKRAPRPPAAHGPVLSSDVDIKEFSRVFAAVLLDERGRKAVAPLLEASGGWVTPREMLFFDYLLGQVDRKEIVRAIQQTTDPREIDIFTRQIAIVRSMQENPKAEE